MKKKRHYQIDHLYRYFNIAICFLSFDLKELELYKEELQTKPALLAVNKMDLPDAQDKFHVLMNQLQNPKGKPVHSFSASLMNICFCFIDYAKAFDYVDHNKLWKILKEMGIPDHLTCLLRNLYAGQEATVRTGHGTTDWFQIGKGVRQVCILSPCLFNLYAEYIRRNAGLEETQLESRLLGEISITSDMWMTPPLWQKVKKN